MRKIGIVYPLEVFESHKISYIQVNNDAFIQHLIKNVRKRIFLA